MCDKKLQTYLLSSFRQKMHCLLNFRSFSKLAPEISVIGVYTLQTDSNDCIVSPLPTSTRHIVFFLNIIFM